VVFASVATLGRSEYLNEQYFSPDYFQYVVIDEYDIIGLGQKAA
jgi:superfamily II DNA or RNA helicase